MVAGSGSLVGTRITINKESTVIKDNLICITQSSISSPGSFRSDDAIDADVDETGFPELFSIRAAISRSLSRRSVKPSSIEVEYPSEELRLCL